MVRGGMMEANVILPAEGYPLSAGAAREWFQRTYGHEASEKEPGELLGALAGRDSDRGWPGAESGVTSASAGQLETPWRQRGYG